MPKVHEKYFRARAADIVAAAAVCFARSGYGGASMESVSREAGMSVGALYRYFPSKEALFTALARAAREAGMPEKEDAPPAARLAAHIDAFFDAVTDPKRRPLLALDIRLRGEALDSALIRREFRAAYQARLRALGGLIAGASGRPCNDKSVAADALALVGVLNEAGLQALLNPDVDVRAIRASARRIAAAMGEPRKTRPRRKSSAAP